MRVNSTLAGATFLLAITTEANANPYDDCILQHMTNTQNQTVAFAIESACISKSSVALTRPEFIADSKIYGGEFYVGDIYPRKGFVVKFKNSTNYDATELALVFANRKTHQETAYTETSFRGPMPKGTFVTGLPEPGLGNIIKAGSSSEVFFEVAYIGKLDDFFKDHDWWISVTKGIPTGLASSSSANPQSIDLSFSGTITDSIIDTFGLFGPPGRDLAGNAFSVAIKYAPDEFNNAYYTSYPGAITEKIIINGVKQTFVESNGLASVVLNPSWPPYNVSYKIVDNVGGNLYGAEIYIISSGPPSFLLPTPPVPGSSVLFSFNIPSAATKEFLVGTAGPTSSSPLSKKIDRK